MIKNLGLIGVAFYVLCATQVLALDLEWKTIEPMPSGRYDFGADALNGKIYAIGGNGGANVVLEFDPTVAPNGSWTRKADMPTARERLSSAALNGKIYAIGGGTGVYAKDVVEAFDPISNSWLTMAPMPTPRGWLAVVTLNGKIYAIGGEKDCSPVNAVEEFDPTIGSHGTWTIKASMSMGRAELGLAVLNGKIYAVGGWGGKNVVEEFDPTIGTNGTWTRKADIPTGRDSLRLAVLNGKIYAIGGNGGEKVVEEFDPTVGSEGTWTRKADMPTARVALASISLKGKIYVIGGYNPFTGDTGDTLSTVEMGILSAPVTTQIINGGDAGTLTIADVKGDAILTYSGMGGTKTITCAATRTTVLQGYGIGYLATPIDQSVLPTATVYYPYEVSNSSNGTDTITIEATRLDGATWTIALIDDTNQDGFHQEDENTPLASPVTLRQNESRKFFLKVDVSIAGSTTIRVKANSSTTDSWGDPDERLDTTLTFARGYGVQLSSPADLTGSPSTTVYYTYQLTNTGNATDTITLAASNVAGGAWALTILQDDDQNGVHSATETTQIGSLTLAGGQSNYLFLRVDIPAAEIGATSTNKVIARCSGTDTVAWGDADVVEDISITTCSAPTPYLTLAKYVSPAEPQLPGATLTYTLKYKNEGTAEAINVMIQDVIPEWASYVANSGTGTVGSGGGDSITVTYNDATKVITFTVNGTVQPQGSGECRFSVVIK